MSDTSDGDTRKKVYVRKNINKASRSHSLELNYTESEIKNIIGQYDEQNSEAISNATLSSKEGTKEIEAPKLFTQGNFDKFETLLDQDDVFKPKNSVLRSPKENTDDCNFLDKNTKRPNTSPEIGGARKKQCENSESAFTPQKDDPRNTTFMTPNIIATEKNESTEDEEKKVIDNILREIENIEQATNKSKDGEIFFSKNEQSVVREASFALLKNLTKLAHRLGHLEKENNLLKQTNPFNSRQYNTYAKVLTTKPQQIKPSITAWSTPPTISRIETIIRIPENEDPKKTIQTLKENVKNKDIGGALKNIRPIKDGGIIIESHSKEQQEKLTKALVNNDNIKIKEIGRHKPRFMVTGIERGYEEKEFLSELIQQNPEVLNAAPEDEFTKMIVVAKKMCRNPLKENWIIEAPANIVKWFLKRQIINFDLVATYVQEYLPLAMCFKCCGFGHVAKYCVKEDICFKCSKKHSSKTCEETEYQCVNCCLMRYTETKHNARDWDCPVYKKKLERTRQYVSYNTNENFLE